MRTIAKEDVLKGMKEGTIRIFYNYGITCMIGNYSFYFADGELDDYTDLEEFLEDYTPEEIAGMIADTISDSDTSEENGIEEEDWDYIYKYIHRGEYLIDNYLSFVFSYAEIGIIKQALLDSLGDMEKTGRADTDMFRETEILFDSLNH